MKSLKDRPTVEVLEIQVEKAWLSLGERPRAIYVTPTGRVGDTNLASKVKSSELVGRFMSGIRLVDFRAEVFHVWEGMRR